MTAPAPTIQRPALLGALALSAGLAMAAACLSLLTIAHASGGGDFKRVVTAHKPALLAIESR